MASKRVCEYVSDKSRKEKKTENKTEKEWKNGRNKD